MAIASTRQLIVELRANTQQFAQGMRRVEQRMDGVARTASKLGSVLGTVLAGGALLGGFGRLISNMDKLNKEAQRLGDTVENLSALQFVADSAGIAWNTFFTILQRGQKRIGEVASGLTGGGLQTVFERLKLDVEELAALQPTEQLFKILKAVREIKREAEQSAIIAKIFDIEGQAIRVVIRDLDDYIKKFDEANRITQQQADTASKFEQSLGDLRNTMVSLTPIVTFFASIIILVAEAFRFAWNEGARYFDQLNYQEIILKTRLLREEEEKLADLLEGQSNAATLSKLNERAGLGGQDIERSRSAIKALREEIAALKADYGIGPTILPPPPKLKPFTIDGPSGPGRITGDDSDPVRAMAALKQETDRAADSAERLSSEGLQVGYAFSTGFVQAASGASTLENALMGVVRQLSQIALTAAFSPVSNAIAGIVTGLFNPTDPLANNVAAIKLRHGGGMMASGEAYRMREGEIVVPNTASQAIMPGAGNVTIENRGGPLRVIGERVSPGERRLIVAEAVEATRRDYSDSMSTGTGPWAERIATNTTARRR